MIVLTSLSRKQLRQYPVGKRRQTGWQDLEWFIDDAGVVLAVLQRTLLTEGFGFEMFGRRGRTFTSFHGGMLSCDQDESRKALLMKMNRESRRIQAAADLVSELVPPAVTATADTERKP